MKKRLLKVLIYTLIITIFILIYKYLFYNHNIKIECPIHKLTGFYCPGCGVTRMLFSLLKLDFYQAFRYNPLVFIFLPLILICLIDYLVSYIKGKETIVYRRINNKVWIFLLVVTLVFGIMRNTDKFSYLAPTEVNKETLKN